MTLGKGHTYTIPIDTHMIFFIIHQALQSS